MTSLNLYLGVIFSTGAISLIYQVAWQRYFTILAGADARSSTLVVAVFLAGLSAGYFYFGQLTTKYQNRRLLLKAYGFVEFITGAWAILFPTFFNFIYNSALGSSPSLFASLVAITILIFPATFLMGATVPVMTTVLPTSFAELPKVHAKVYGVNTIGAFVGPLVGGIFLINEFGLSLSLIIAGFLNIFASLVYLNNQLEGDVLLTGSDTAQKETLDPKLIYFLSFITGTFLIGLEMFWFRLWSLTIGTNLLVFPMVLSIFVLGLGIGSLRIKDNSKNELWLNLGYGTIFLIISFIVAPILPIWVSNIRVMFSNIVFAMAPFYFVTYLLLALIIFPFSYFLGKVLPLCYGLLPKEGGEYGKQCGMLYFINTVGTFIGSIFLGYLFLKFMNLDTLYRLICIVMAVLTIWLGVHFKMDKTRLALVSILPFVSMFYFWDREYHSYGTFRDRDYSFRQNFKGLFHIPKSGLIPHSLRDYPISTVAVASFEADRFLGFKTPAVMTNGKSDSSSWNDYGTLTLSAIFPYQAFQNERKITSSVIGLGTGVTAGLMGVLPNTEKVDVVEISQGMIEAQPHFTDTNFGIMKNKRVKIHLVDAFKFYRDKENHYDVIVSEPSNPWVLGVENLFTPEFYDIAKKSLKPDGVLAQWIQNYSMSADSYRSIMHNLVKSFKTVRVFQTQRGDHLAMASNRESFNFDFSDLSGELYDGIFKKLNVDKDFLNLLEVFDENDILMMTENQLYREHSLFFPTLNYETFKDFYIGKTLNPATLINPQIARLAQDNKVVKRREKIFIDYYEKWRRTGRKCEDKITVFIDINCDFASFYRVFEDFKQDFDMFKKIHSYAILRKEKLMSKNIPLLQAFGKVMIKFPTIESQLLKVYLEQFLMENEVELFDKELVTFIKRRGINKEFVSSVRKMREDFVIKIQNVNSLLSAKISGKK